MSKYNIPSFQHRFFQRISIFAFKTLNFSSSPKILHENILDNFLKLSSSEMNVHASSYSVRSLRNRNIDITLLEISTKFFRALFPIFLKLFYAVLG